MSEVKYTSVDSRHPIECPHCHKSFACIVNSKLTPPVLSLIDASELSPTVSGDRYWHNPEKKTEIKPTLIICMTIDDYNKHSKRKMQLKEAKHKIKKLEQQLKEFHAERC